MKPLGPPVSWRVSPAQVGPLLLAVAPGLATVNEPLPVTPLSVFCTVKEVVPVGVALVVIVNVVVFVVFVSLFDQDKAAGLNRAIAPEGNPVALKTTPFSDPEPPSEVTETEYVAPVALVGQSADGDWVPTLIVATCFAARAESVHRVIVRSDRQKLKYANRFITDPPCLDKC